MKRFYIPFLLLFITGIFIASCGKNIATTVVLPTNTNEQSNLLDTPDLNATVNAAVQATDSSQQALEATVDTAVKATVSAIPGIVTTPLPPTATPVNVVVLTEEELAALIDSAVQESTNAYNQAASTTAQSTSDGTMTTEEIQNTYYSYYYTSEQIDEALVLIEQYMALYGELGQETINLLAEIEQDLSEMESSIDQMTATLNQINTTLTQGLELATDTVTQLQSQAAQAQAAISEMQTKASQWMGVVKAEIENYSNQVAVLQSTQLANDRREALAMGREYIATVRNSLGDGKISQGEMLNIAQLGVNASASLSKVGGPEMQRFADAIQGINRNVARGEIPSARNNLDGLERDLPGR